MGFITKEDLSAILTNLNTKLLKKPTAVRLTQAQYDALTNEQIHDTSKAYYIIDAGGTPTNVYSESSVGNLVSGATVHDESVGGSGNHLYKRGDAVEICLTLDGVYSTSWSTVIGVIPEGYRPKKRLRIVGHAGATKESFDITTDGNIYSCSNLSNAEVWIECMWFAV